MTVTAFDKAIEGSGFDFYTEDDDVSFSVTVRCEWIDGPVEGEELASVDNETDVRDFLLDLSDEGFDFDFEEHSWVNEEGGYVVYAFKVKEIV